MGNEKKRRGEPPMGGAHAVGTHGPLSGTARGNHTAVTELRATLEREEREKGLPKSVLFFWGQGGREHRNPLGRASASFGTLSSSTERAA